MAVLTLAFSVSLLLSLVFCFSFSILLLGNGHIVAIKCGQKAITHIDSHQIDGWHIKNENQIEEKETRPLKGTIWSLNRPSTQTHTHKHI